MEDLALPANEQLSPSEVSLAVQLIDGMSALFNPTKYSDTYTDELKKLIEAKAKGQKRRVAPPKPSKSNVIDLVSAVVSASPMATAA